MSTDDSTPEFVYRLAAPEEWRAAEETGVVPEREIDRRDGYMHLSTHGQVIETANLHFADAEELVVLEIPLSPISHLVKFELAPKRGEHFPHLYAALRKEQVTCAIPLAKTKDGFIWGHA